MGLEGREKERERRERERERPPVHWSTPQRTAPTMAGPGGSQETGTSSSSLPWNQGPKHMHCLSLLSQGHGHELKVKSWESNRCPLQDAVIAGRGLTH